MYTYKLATIFNEKRDNEFEREQRGAYGSVWREEREEGNVVIIF